MNKLIGLAFFVISALSLLGVARAQDHLWNVPSLGVFGGFLQSAFLALVLFGIIVLALTLRSRGTSNVLSMKIKPSDPALQILRERLARVEIDPEDYEARWRMLVGSDVDQPEQRAVWCHAPLSPRIYRGFSDQRLDCLCATRGFSDTDGKSLPPVGFLVSAAHSFYCS